MLWRRFSSLRSLPLLFILFLTILVLRSLLEASRKEIKWKSLKITTNNKLTQQEKNSNLKATSSKSLTAVEELKKESSIIHKNHSSLFKKELNILPNASDLERIKEHFIPPSHRKDAITLKKYIAYITKREEPLPFQTNAVIILTNYRSGSSFFGELFNQHPEIFYVFEPLILLSPTDRCDLNLPLKRRIIEEVSQCSFPDWSKIYYDLDKATRPKRTGNVFACLRKYFCFYPFTKELIEEENCPRSPSLKFDPWDHCGPVNLNLTNNICRRKKMVAIKLIRLCDINQLEELVTKHNINLKVIHLIRDPRGIANSRRILHRRLMLPRSLAITCSRQATNANVGMHVKPQWLEGRYKMFRYEDAAINPFKTAKDVYDFIGVEFTDSVKHWIINNTSVAPLQQRYGSVASLTGEVHNDKGEVVRGLSPSEALAKREEYRASIFNPWGHKRDSKSVVQRWQHSLSYLQAQTIEARCHEIMKIAGYIPLSNPKEYKNKSKRYFIDDFLN